MEKPVIALSHSCTTRKRAPLISARIANSDSSATRPARKNAFELNEKINVKKKGKKIINVLMRTPLCFACANVPRRAPIRQHAVQEQSHDRAQLAKIASTAQQIRSVERSLGERKCWREKKKKKKKMVILDAIRVAE
jgi:hypothetical protein